jgi:DNA (cytosine-5)-methyltransferase 1
MPRTLVAVDLFSGAGGLSEGLTAAGIHVAVAVEKDYHAALTHAFNHPHTSVICDDLGRIGKREILSQVGCKTGSTTVDIVAGGPPCQGFSSAGRQLCNDSRNDLIWEFVRAVKEIRPRCFVFENVPEIASVAQGRLLRRLLEKFASCGYQVTNVDVDKDPSLQDLPIVDAASLGVPQRRRRLLLVGWLGGCSTFKWAPLSNGQGSKAESQVSVHDAISDLAFLRGGFESHSYELPATTRFQRERRRGSIAPFNHLASSHRPATVAMFRHFSQGGTVNSIPEHLRTGKQRRARLNPNTVSHAVVGLQDDFIHYSRHRVPTVRELARLQSFDDGYVFFGKRTANSKSRALETAQYTQVGNAVPPLVAKSLGRAIITALGSEHRDRRDMAERISRQKLVLGTSAHAGYQLGKTIVDSVRLYDRNGTFVPIRLVDSGMAIQPSTVRWFQRKCG